MNRTFKLQLSILIVVSSYHCQYADIPKPPVADYRYIFLTQPSVVVEKYLNTQGYKLNSCIPVDDFDAIKYTTHLNVAGEDLRNLNAPVRLEIEFRKALIDRAQENVRYMLISEPITQEEKTKMLNSLEGNMKAVFAKTATLKDIDIEKFFGTNLERWVKNTARAYRINH